MRIKQEKYIISDLMGHFLAIIGSFLNLTSQKQTMDEEENYLRKAVLTLFFEQERKEMEWTTLVWTVQNYNKLQEDVMYFRKSRMFCEKWSIKLAKTQKLLFLILHAHDPKLFVNFTILGRNGMALNEGIASEFVGGQYVADFDRALITARDGYLMDDQLTIQCKYVEKPLHDTLTPVNPPNYLEEEVEILSMRMDLWKVFISEICSDFKISMPPIEFNVHKAVLVVRTHFFAAMFEEEYLQENDAEMQCDADPLIFYKMLQYIYTARFEETSVDDVLALFELARCFGVKGLVSECSKSLSRNMTVDNVDAIFLMASKYGCNELKFQTIRFMSNQCPELLKHDEIKIYLDPMQDKEIPRNVIQLLSRVNIRKYISKEAIFKNSIQVLNLLYYA